MVNFGCDPEVFSTITLDNKEFVLSPALLKEEGLIKPVSTRVRNHPAYINNRQFKWHMDGVAFELTLKEVYSNSLDLHRIINDSLDSLREFLYPLSFRDHKINLTVMPTVNINPTMYDLSVEDIFQGFIFGCDKDQDLDPNYECKTVDVFNHPYRYGGGHVHTSCDFNLHDFYIPFTMMQAVTVGNYVTANSLFPEEDKKRILTYGKPCRFRLQNYKDGTKGVEYRTPSNSWILYDIEKFTELFSLVEENIIRIQKGDNSILHLFEESKNAIINFDQETSRRILGEI